MGEALAGRLRNLSGAILGLSDDDGGALHEAAAGRTADTATGMACRALYELLQEASAFDDRTPGTRTEAGLALAPALASHCLLDAPRTSVFARGVLHAIRKARQSAPRKPVEVVYAGTGPFAPLALLAMPYLHAGTVAFTLLDLHEESVRSVRTLIGALGFEAHVRDVVCADATQYRHARPIDVLVTETMQRTLAEEPFVSIVRNFRPQLSAAATMIPERVALHLVSVDAPADPAHWPSPFEGREHLGELFAIDAAGELPAEGADTTLSIPHLPGTAPKWLALETEVVVGGAATLAPHASGLTEPEILWNCSPIPAGLTLTFRYDAGPHPGLRRRKA